MSKLIKKTALVGGGVIGGGWAARLVLNGIDVKVFDPSDTAERTLKEILANAELAYSKLTMAPLVKQGNIEFVDSIKKAVKNVQFIQESVPENPDFKRSIINEIAQFAPESALICSSTSGIKPTSLQSCLSFAAC
jgi:carnitine 3-dehydrogenase